MPTSTVDGVALYFGRFKLDVVEAVDGCTEDDSEDHMVFLALSTAPWPGALCFKGVSLAWGTRLGLVFFFGGIVKRCYLL